MVPPDELTLYCPGAEKPLNLRDDFLNRSLLDKERFRDFMSNWVERTIQAAQNGQPFDALICLWIMFNAWLGEVVVDRGYTETDWYLVQAAGRDRNLSNRFLEILEKNADLRGEASEFQSLWPVFKVRTLLDHGIRPWRDENPEEDRHEYRGKCFSYKLKRWDYAPPCFCDHQK
jgi:hypothetical protein